MLKKEACSPQLAPAIALGNVQQHAWLLHYATALGKSPANFPKIIIENIVNLEIYLAKLFSYDITSTAFSTASIAVGLLINRKLISDVIRNGDGFLSLSKP